jgi:phospholipase C
MGTATAGSHSGTGQRDMSNGSGLGSVNHAVVLMLENRSFDHMLGFLYSGQGNALALPVCLLSHHPAFLTFRWWWPPSA